MRLQTNHWLAIGVVTLSVVWLVTGLIFNFDGEAEEEAAVAPLRVVVDTLAYRPMPGGLSISGRTEANHATTAHARTSGIIIDLPVAEGAMVREGQVVARLSDEARGEAVREAQARLDQATASYTASAELAEQGFFPRLQLDQSRAEQAAAQAALDRARAEAARGVITAPVDGVLDGLLVEPGEAVQIGADIASIVDLDPVVAAAGVSDAERPSVVVGDPAEVRLQDGRIVTGNIRFLATSADPATATYRMEVEVPNPDGAILAGQIADIRLLGTGVRAARLVRSAVTLDANGQIGVKYIGGDGRVAFAPVTIVQDAPDGLWISGPPEGVAVIVRGQEFANAGAAVQTVSVQEAEAQAAAAAAGTQAE